MGEAQSCNISLIYNYDSRRVNLALVSFGKIKTIILVAIYVLSLRWCNDNNMLLSSF